MHKFLATSALLVCLATPAAAANAPSFDLNGLLATATADLEAAKANADAHGDTVASQCYGGIEANVAAHPLALPNVGDVKGVASAFQVARNAVKAAQSVQANAGIPPELEMACGPLALDVQSDLGKAATTFSVLGLHL